MISIDEDSLDDLLYFSRTASLADLQALVSSLQTSSPQAPSAASILSSVDPASGNTCLHYAAANGHTDVVRWILSQLTSPTSASNDPAAGDQSNHLGPAGDEPVLTNGGGAADGKQPAETSLLDVQNSAGNTALHWAAVNGHLDVVRLLVEAGADAEVSNAAGRDVLAEAVGAERWEVVGWLGGRMDGEIMGEEEQGGEAEDKGGEAEDKGGEGRLEGEGGGRGDGVGLRGVAAGMGQDGEGGGVEVVTDGVEGVRLQDRERG